jgi:hypothetical protein
VPGTDARGAAWAARVTARLRETGVAGTLRKAVRDHLVHASDSVIVEYRRGWRDVRRPDPPPGLRLVTIRGGDALPPLCDWMAWRAPAFEAMLAESKTGVFLLDGDRAIGCAWFSLADHHDPAAGEHFRVGPREAYHYCWMLDPAGRRGNAGIVLLREVMAELDALGIERQFGVVDIANRASYLLQYRYGYRECGYRVTHYRLLGRRFVRMRRYSGTLGPVPMRDRP